MWIEPITNRPNADTRTTATDMNRIANNMAELGGTPLKTNYVETDIVMTDEWKAIVEFVKMHDSGITDSTRYDNLNRIELMMKRLHTANTWGTASASTWGEIGQTTWNEVLGGI